MIVDEGEKPAEFMTLETATVLNAHRVKPELGSAVVTLHMNMWWLLRVLGIEEEAIRT